MLFLYLINVYNWIENHREMRSLFSAFRHSWKMIIGNKKNGTFGLEEKKKKQQAPNESIDWKILLNKMKEIMIAWK